VDSWSISQTQDHKKWLAIHQHALQKRCLHMTNIERSKVLYPHHSHIIIRKSTENGHPYISSASHNRCYYVSNLERSKTLSQHFLLFYAWCVHCTQCPHIFTTGFQAMLNTKPRCTLIIGHAINKMFNQCTR